MNKGEILRQFNDSTDSSQEQGRVGFALEKNNAFKNAIHELSTLSSTLEHDKPVSSSDILKLKEAL